MALVAHLRADPVEAGQAEKLTRLADGLGEGLLDVDVLAEHHRHVGGQEVHVVRGGHAHRVDLVVHLEQHLPEVGVEFRLREGLAELLHVGAGGVDVAERDDLLVLLRHGVAEALAAAADLREAHLGARGDRTGLAGLLRQRGAAREAERRRGQRREADEIATIEV